MANNIRITGRLAADLEVRYTADGKALCRLRIPVYAGKNKAGGYNPSLWFQAVLWEDAAENASNNFHKGDDLIVEGYLGYEEWEKRDGTKQGAYTINKPEVRKEKR
jgi:single-strand DNA-binding protein